VKTTLTVSPKLGHCKWQSGRAYAYAASDQIAHKIFFFCTV